MATRKCKVCKIEFEKQQPLQFVCSPKCGIEYTKIQNAKKAEKERLQNQRLQRAKKRELETIPELTRKAQAAFNRFIRLRDRFKPCISCGKPNNGTSNTFDVGHYRSVGSAAHLRFDENNVHGQCKKCNQYLSGNAVAYRAGLINRIGLAAVEALEANHTPRKWSKDELRNLAALYRQKCRELE